MFGLGPAGPVHHFLTHHHYTTLKGASCLALALTRGELRIHRTRYTLSFKGLESLFSNIKLTMGDNWTEMTIKIQLKCYSVIDHLIASCFPKYLKYCMNHLHHLQTFSGV